MKIEVLKEDITKLKVDAIVNPANSLGYMGGGLAGVIKRVGGEIIEKEVLEKAPIPIGNSVITSGGKLQAKYVIHAPTMEKPAERTNPKNIKLALFSALKCAEKNKIKSLAIPGLGTGVGGVSPKTAAKAMIEVIKKFQFKNIEKIFLVAIDEDLYKNFKKEVENSFNYSYQN